jgi:amino acid transporter
MAPNYGEESRNPKRNVALALYVSVIGLLVFYALTSWAGISGYNSIHSAARVAQKASATFFFLPANRYLGHWAATAMSYLIITGSFACGMAFHNTASRYFYSLGRERVLPAALGKTHDRWKSPHVATITQSVIAAIIVGLFALFVGTNTPTSQAYVQLYGLMAVMGVIIIVAIQALVSVAIWRYFRMQHPTEHHVWKTMLAPWISFVAQAVVLYLLFDNLTLIGGGIGYANIFGPIDAGVFVVGIGTALYLKRKSPARFEAVGRLINEGV